MALTPTEQNVIEVIASNITRVDDDQAIELLVLAAFRKIEQGVQPTQREARAVADIATGYEDGIMTGWGAEDVLDEDEEVEIAESDIDFLTNLDSFIDKFIHPFV